MPSEQFRLAAPDGNHFPWPFAEEFESPMGLATNWWAKAYRFANFSLGGPYLREGSRDLDKVLTSARRRYRSCTGRLDTQPHSSH